MIRTDFPGGHTMDQRIINLYDRFTPGE